MTEYEIGVLVGVLIGEGSFGGDGRQASITVRMHTRHEALFRFLDKLVVGSRLYGPYNHSGREYYQWIVRGQALKRLLPLLDDRIVPEIDGHAATRYEAMKAQYRLYPTLSTDGE